MSHPLSVSLPSSPIYSNGLDLGTASIIAETLRHSPVENPIYAAPETFKYVNGQRQESEY